MKDRITLRKLTEEYKAAIGDRWDSKTTVVLEHEAFRPLHLISRGRNGVSKTLELSKVSVELRDVLFWRDQSGSSPIELYVNADAETEHGFGRYRSKFIVLTKAGKESELTLRKTWDVENSDIGRMQSLFGYDIEGKTREETNDFYKRIVCDIDRDRQAFTELAESHGYKVKLIFEYTHRFLVRPSYVKQTNRMVEFGIVNVSTYNSLPEIIRLRKMREVKTVGLYELGVETKGYYSHDDRMQVLPESASAARAFGKRFQRSANSERQKAIRKALK